MINQIISIIPNVEDIISIPVINGNSAKFRIGEKEIKNWLKDDGMNPFVFTLDTAQVKNKSIAINSNWGIVEGRRYGQKAWWMA